MVEQSEMALDVVFRALASAPRREILRRAASEPRTVTQLAEHFDMSLAAVSKHVQVLTRAKLLTLREDGRLHWCRLRPESLDIAASSIDELRSFWNDRLDGLDTFLRANRRKRR
jgi:DNA-binding transcriptional ArsR family regulator